MIKIIIAIVLIIILYSFVKSIKNDVKYVKSDIDNVEYLVLDMINSQEAANMLARIKKNIFKMVHNLDKNKDNKYKEFKKYIKQLSKRIKNVKINEGSTDGRYTSYSVNKGEQLVFCLRSKNNKINLHDMNLMMYVVLHEMAHIACPEYGHTDLFKKIFAFFTNVAINIGKYKRIKFGMNPSEYCGLTITSSIV